MSMSSMMHLRSQGYILGSNACLGGLRASNGGTPWARLDGAQGGPPAGSTSQLDLFVILGQLRLVQSWDHLFAEQLNGAHDVLMAHGSLIAVDMQVTGMQAVDHLEQLPSHGLGTADND